MTNDNDHMENMKDFAKQAGEDLIEGYKTYSKSPYGRKNAANTAVQVVDAVRKASAGGAGLSGSLVAGAGVITAKVAVVGAVATAALPFVATAACIGAAGYGIKKIASWVEDNT